MAIRRNLYRGFSTQEYQFRKSFVLRDIRLVQQDLLNDIFTERRERVMMPNFGTRIASLIFEPLDNGSLFILREDLTNSINRDPRVELASDLRIIPIFENRTVIAGAELNYIELEFTDQFSINIEFETGTVQIIQDVVNFDDIVQ